MALVADDQSAELARPREESLARQFYAASSEMQLITDACDGL
jgi:hypothetical protein